MNLVCSEPDPTVPWPTQVTVWVSGEGIKELQLPLCPVCSKLLRVAVLSHAGLVG